MTKEEAIKYLQQLYPYGGHCWLDEQRIEAVGMAIKALQEEPVNKDFEMALAEMIDKAQTSVVEPLVVAAQWKDELIKLAKSEEPVSEDLGDYINKLSKQFPEVSFAKLSRIAVRVSRWQRNQDTKNKLPEVINRTDLDEYAYQCAYDMSNDWMIENPTWHDVENACKLGAKWQLNKIKEKYEENRD